MPPPLPLRFVAGRSLGGLARWLPAPGFDTLHAPDLSGRAAIAAAKSGRILVTRNRNCAAAPAFPAWFSSLPAVPWISSRR